MGSIISLVLSAFFILSIGLVLLLSFNILSILLWLDCISLISIRKLFMDSISLFKVGACSLFACLKDSKAFYFFVALFELSGIVIECVERLLKFVKTLFAS